MHKPRHGFSGPSHQRAGDIAASSARHYWCEALEGRVLFAAAAPASVAGSPDLSFGVNGRLVVSQQSATPIAVPLASVIQPDGKAVIVGEAYDPTDPPDQHHTLMAVARINVDGTP